MTGRLAARADVARYVAGQLAEQWPAAVCAELTGGPELRIACRLSPGVRNRGHLEEHGVEAWHAWEQSWTSPDLPDVPGVVVSRKVLPGWREVPAEIRVTGVDAALAFVRATDAHVAVVDVQRARRVSAELTACGAKMQPGTLRALSRLADDDLAVVVQAIGWLQAHPDVGQWTARALPIPGADSKWLETHAGLLRTLVGRDLAAELRPRLAVAHVTYVDPEYLESGARRHDAWTTDDHHELPYEPSVVVVVENRDCRLWFPPLRGGVVVEGGGAAASALLAGVRWIRNAATVVYWGDLDADGFAILDRFRADMATASDELPGIPVASVLMDLATLERYGDLGVTRDRRGRPIGPRSAPLPNLTDQERAAYYSIATTGTVPVRRIEQERLPIELAAESVARLVRA